MLCFLSCFGGQIEYYKLEYNNFPPKYKNLREGIFSNNLIDKKQIHPED